MSRHEGLSPGLRAEAERSDQLRAESTAKRRANDDAVIVRSDEDERLPEIEVSAVPHEDGFWTGRCFISDWFPGYLMECGRYRFAGDFPTRERALVEARRLANTILRTWRRA